MSDDGGESKIGSSLPRIAILAIVTAWCTCGEQRALAVPLRTVPIVFVVLSDDDGRHAAGVRPARLKEWVEFTNSVFDVAGIHFLFDPPTGIATHRSTVLNRLGAGKGEAWARAKAAGNTLAAEHPGAVVVLVRHGPGKRATGAGFAGSDFAFVVGAGTEATSHCRGWHDDFLAHEIGHYLGLSHTFAGVPFKSLAAAEAHFVSHGSYPSVFDGDRLADTAPDPAIRALECRDVDGIALGGVAFDLPRDNIMSYYEEKDRLSPRQAEIARWVLEERLASPDSMGLPVNAPGADAIEAETMPIRSARNVGAGVQHMSHFGAGSWSGGAQLFGRAAGPGAEVTLGLVVRSSLDGAALYAARAPDFARVQIVLDGVDVGEAIDLYAPMVVPSGPIALESEGEPLRLEPGEHELTIRVVGRNERSTGWAFGIDALGLLPVDLPSGVPAEVLPFP